MQEESPIFVRALSRSGGTLVVTILDAHPDIAMSYELYPVLLELDDGNTDNILRLADILDKSRSIKNAADKVRSDKLKTFILRAPRGGLNHKELAQIFRDHAEENQTLNTMAERLQLIARCCRLKMKKEGKTRWGLKCTNSLVHYVKVWPGAYFFNMLRDGRDVLASQLSTGSFVNTPFEVGRSWFRTNKRFRKLIKKYDVNAYQIKYENLVENPQTEIRQITDFLGLKYYPEMLDYYQKDLTIYSTSHLSMKRISNVIDTSKIGRWKNELNEKQLEEFNMGSKWSLEKYGYSKE